MSDPFFYLFKMLAEFEKKIADFIKANIRFDSAGRVLLAISGGADSTALLHAMHALKTAGVLEAELLCAHINHQLRGPDSKGDEDSVVAEAKELKLAVTIRRLDVRSFARENKLSIETAGRKLRIESLLDIARANKCKWIATAHQKNDNAETIIHRLCRGTGFRGLGGIWPVRAFDDDVSFIRPLLGVTREQIIEYLKRRNLKWRTDKTNRDCTYRRNYIRHRLLPALQGQYSSSIVEQLYKLSQSAQRFYKLVCSEAEKIWPAAADCCGDRVKLDWKMLSGRQPAVKVELVRRSLTAVGSGERDLTQAHYERILQLAEQRVSGKRIELPGGFVAGYEYGSLIFSRSDELQKKTRQIVDIDVPGTTRFCDYVIEAAVFEAGSVNINRFKRSKDEFIEWFDMDKVSLPLAVRFRQAGDRFVPLGLTEEKRIGKFLTSAKVPQDARRKILVVADSKKVIWVWPIRISQQAKVTDQTRKILQLRIGETATEDTAQIIN